MTLPFSRDEFFAVFARYNEAVWPAQIVIYLLAAVAVALALSKQRDSTRGMFAVLAILWMWMALVYHGAFFFKINSLAAVFAVAFIIQSFVFGVLASKPMVKAVVPENNFSGWAGGLLILFGTVFYPVLSIAKGHVYPFQPTFGLPCPTTIFTLGLMAWAWDATPRVAFVIPILWAIVGSVGAVQLGVPEDLSLAGSLIVIGIAALMRKPLSLESRLAAYRKYGVT